MQLLILTFIILSILCHGVQGGLRGGREDKRILSNHASNNALGGHSNIRLTGEEIQLQVNHDDYVGGDEEESKMESKKKSKNKNKNKNKNGGSGKNHDSSGNMEKDAASEADLTPSPTRDDDGRTSNDDDDGIYYPAQAVTNTTNPSHTEQATSLQIDDGDSEEGDDDSEEGDDDSEEGDDDSEEGDDETEEGDDETEEDDDETEEGDDETEEVDDNTEEVDDDTDYSQTDDDSENLEDDNHASQAEETSEVKTNSPTSSPIHVKTTNPPKSTTSSPTKVPTSSPTKSVTSSPVKNPTASPMKSNSSFSITDDNLMPTFDEEGKNDDFDYDGATFSLHKTVEPTPTTVGTAENDDGDITLEKIYAKLSDEETEFMNHYQFKEEEEEAAKISLVYFFITAGLMIFTAHQLSENPDGVYSNVCRLMITVTGCVFKIILLPAKKMGWVGSRSGYAHHLVTTQTDFKDPYSRTNRMEII